MKIDVTDAIEDWQLSYNLGNAVEAIAQAQTTGELQDLKKAKWHIERQIQLSGGKAETKAPAPEPEPEEEGKILEKGETLSWNTPKIQKILGKKQK